MATRTFGRRGAIPPIRHASFRPAPATAAAAPAAIFDAPSAPSPAAPPIGEKNLLDDIAFLTGGLIVFLMLIFGIETKAAFDVGKDGSLSVHSLIAFGATSRDLVVGAHEWWRLGLAPLLHASASHLLGNSVALFFVGIRLEPTIGRGWFALIFVVSAIGGEIGSLCGNPPGIPGVGASGAITGLVGALFAVSFNPYGEAEHQRVMRKTALFFGVPALAPLAFGASGHVDYFAHAGGAIAGAVLGLALAAVWSADDDKPRFGRQAAIVSLVALALSAVSGVIAVTHYSKYAASAAQFIRSADLPTTVQAGAEKSADLVRRYPKDPRAHLMRAFHFLSTQQLSAAEAELHTAITLADQDPVAAPVRQTAQAVLAVIMLERGRRAEAKTLAAEGCRAPSDDPMRVALAKVKLCD
jgi:membrane associated rhomboid family serine protease